jgi:hypothetical protein
VGRGGLPEVLPAQHPPRCSISNTTSTAKCVPGEGIRNPFHFYHQPATPNFVQEHLSRSDLPSIFCPLQEPKLQKRKEKKETFFIYLKPKLTLETERAGLAVMLQICVREVVGSDLRVPQFFA